MSGDGPTKLAHPEALPLDEIILAEEDSVDLGAPSDKPNDGSKGDDRPDSKDAKETRKRTKMTLRIPDDEVARPTGPSAPPTAPAAKPQPELTGPLRPHRIVSIGPDDTGELPLRPPSKSFPPEPPAPVRASAPPPEPALGVDPTMEPGWTPFQPPVEPFPDGGPRPPLAESPPIDRAPTLEIKSAEMPATEEEPAPLSDEIPVDTDDGFGADSPDDIPTNPRIIAMDPDPDEIRIEEAREPHEHAEIGPEDLVSIESIPSPNAPRPPPPKGSPGGKTATALMAGAPSPSSPSLPPAPIASAPPPMEVPAAAEPVMVAPIVEVAAAPPGDALAPRSPDALGRGPASPGEFAAARPAVQGQEPLPPMRPPSTSSESLVDGKAASAQALQPPPMNEAAANRKKVRPWWEELFNDDFIRTMAKITDPQIAEEVSFVEESLGCEAGAMILDLACGTGRHAIELARRGYQVVGFDLSLSMLARAADEAQERKQKINFVQGDMREMTFDGTFDGVYSWGTSFGYFDEEKNNAVIAKVHRALKKSGQFVLDVVNRDYIVRQAPSLAWFEGDGCICMDEMTIDFITSRMKVKRTLMMDDGRTKEIEYSIRLYSLHELGKLLHDNGFRVAEVSGRTATPGVFFGCESPRTLILAEKR